MGSRAHRIGHGRVRMTSAFEKHRYRYEALLKSGVTQARIVNLMILDELAELEAAEMHDVDAADQKALSVLVSLAANELGVEAPRVRFFRSKGLPHRGVVLRDRPYEAWVGGDKPWIEHAEIALHEVAHLAHLDDDSLTQDAREMEAQRFASRNTRAPRSGDEDRHPVGVRELSKSDATIATRGNPATCPGARAPP